MSLTSCLQCIRWLHAIVNGPAIHSFQILVSLLRSDVSFRKCLRAEDVRGHVDTQVLNTWARIAGWVNLLLPDYTARWVKGKTDANEDHDWCDVHTSVDIWLKNLVVTCGPLFVILFNATVSLHHINSHAERVSLRLGVRWTFVFLTHKNNERI
jgi:hypothetical protein